MSDPVNAGKHPFHDRRWITTEDAEVEFGHDPRSWGLSQGSLVCEMRDGPEANARLIAAAPDYSEATAEVLAAWETGDLAAAVRKLAAVHARAHTQ